MKTNQLASLLIVCSLGVSGVLVQAQSTPGVPIAWKIATSHNVKKASKPSERPAYNPNLTKELVAFWEERVQDEPSGGIALRELAGAYLSLARETGNISHAVQAEKAARQSLKSLPRTSNSSGLIRLSRSLLTQHRFPEALEVADQATENNPEAQRLRADIAIELGNLALAEAAMKKIPVVKGDSKRENDLNYKALRAHLLEAKGQWQPALALRKEAARQSEEYADMPAETAGWYHTMVGHALIDHGRLQEGERNCRRALEIFPLDYRAMTGMAEAAAWREDWKSVIAWGQKAIRIAPENPGVLQMLGDAYEKSGNPKESARYYQMFEKLAASFPRIYDRDWILFSADRKQNLNQALGLARRDLKLRQDAGAYDALAWTCYKAGLLAEAKTNMQKALSKGGGDASVLYHAGMIAYASGERKRANSYFVQAKAFNPYFLKTVSLPQQM